MMLALASLTLLLSSATGLFLDSTPCEAPQPCSCILEHNRQMIHCETQSLKSVPTFHNTSGKSHDINLYLSQNAITDIKTYAFQNLNHSKLNSFILHMDNNKLSQIDGDAFMGVARPLRELYLANNMLTSIPGAFANLTNLQKLDIRNNSIVTYDSRSMSSIGRTLRYLSIGTAGMMQLPRELQYLRYLETLDIYYVGMQALPTDVFHGFESTLHTLRIDSTSIGAINPAICHLTHLQRFYFDNNNYYHGLRSIFEPCITPISSLKLLHISNDSVQDFPPVLSLFPGLTDLYIINNPGLYFMDDTLIPASTKLQNLYLYNDGFTRVPEAVQKMQQLKKLDLHGNRIRLVETHDITDMDALLKLRLDGNSLDYISRTAFQNLPDLQYLYLNGSSITEFPQSITTLPSLRFVHLPNDQIECICDTLGYLKTWQMPRGFNMDGTCEASSDRVLDYIRGYVTRYCKE